MVFRVPLLVAVLLLIAFGGATASAIYALRATAGFGSIDIGPWKAWPLAQTSEADPYAKAHRARAGKLLLGQAEGLVFAAATDSEGATLITRCRYRVTGQTPQARLWTLHTSDENDALMPVDERFPSAFSSQSVLKDSTGMFAIDVARRPKPGNWLALANADQPFKLVLSLFDTPTASSSRLIDIRMPEIVRTGCDRV